mgnify:CR=1 FL=1
MIEFLSFEFGRRALLAGVIVGTGCAVLAFFVVLRRMAFVGVGVSHAALGGVALGVLLGLDPVWSALVFSVGVAWLIGAIGGVLGALGSIAYSLQQSWYQIILPDDQRRLVAPRLGGITLGIGSVVLLPIAFLIDDLVAGIGLWAYAAPLLISGVAGIVPLVVLRRLPAPGRIRVPRSMPWTDEARSRLRRHGNVMSLALLSAGLSPFLSVYAISVLGTGAGFAIALSAISSGTLVLASLYVSSHLRGGSSSRLLRNSFVLRSAALFLGLAAGCGTAYLLGRIRSSFATASKLESVFELPVIGTIFGVTTLPLGVVGQARSPSARGPRP